MTSKHLWGALFLLGFCPWSVAQVSGDLIPFRRGEFWGYCTPDKKIVVEPVYDYADWFRDGLALVGRGCRTDCRDVYDGAFGFIDRQGKEVVPIRYLWGAPFVKGQAFVSDDEGYYSVDKTGKTTVVSQNAVAVTDFQNLPLPAGYKGEGTGKPFLNPLFKGYVSADGTRYWEDPETVFLLPIETIGERHSEHGKAFVRLYTDMNIVMQGQSGTKLRPGLALVSQKEGVPETELFLPLEPVSPTDEDVAYTFLIPDYEKVKPLLKYHRSDADDKKLLFTQSYIIPYDSVKQGLIFRIYQKGIIFISTDFAQPLLDYQSSLRELQLPETSLSVLSRMAGDIQLTARNMKAQGDSQNYLIEGKDNPYQGKYLFDVMEKVTPREVRTFLEYVDARPFQYMGGRWKTSEAFATWVYNGAPRVVKR